MRLILQIVTVLSVVLFLYSCARVSHVFQRKERIYQPPRLGAEYRFEDGLKRERRPDDLFSKKDRREMEKMGMLSKQDRAAPTERITPMQADSILTGKTRDTTQTANPDSMQTVPIDTSQSVRDSTRTVPVDTSQTHRDSSQTVPINNSQTHQGSSQTVPINNSQTHQDSSQTVQINNSQTHRDSSQTVPINNSQTHQDSLQTVPVGTTQTHQRSSQTVPIGITQTMHRDSRPPVPASITPTARQDKPSRSFPFNRHHTTSPTSFLVI